MRLSMSADDWMGCALTLADRAAQEGEVPVGAVLVADEQIIGEGWNQPIAQHDPTAHAEIQAIRDAGKRIGNYRLLDTTLYVTLEPCAMCLGAMIHARIGHLVFGADDPKGGAVKSVFQLLDSQALNHHLTWESGVMRQECSHILTNFFSQKRGKIQENVNFLRER